MITESRKKANKKWDKENMITLSCKVRKELAENLRKYADSQGLTIGVYARRAMEYCKNNNINLQSDNDKVEL
jgi:hypothetical protein